jgi:hypothetical protein
MNDLVGIDPKAPSNLRDLTTLLHIFGPSEGRFILDFPKEWRKDLREHMRSLSDLGGVLADEIIRNRLAHAVLPTNLRYRTNISWLENAIALRDEACKIIGPNGTPKNVAEPIDMVLSDPNAFLDASGALVDRTPEAYVGAARPILMVSRKVVLVDRFFRLKYIDRRGQIKPDARQKVLAQFLKEAVKWKQVEAFEIFYSPQKTERSLECQLRDFGRLAEEVEAGRIAINVQSLDKANMRIQHGRYFLGLRNGLHFDHGFDVTKDGSKNHVEWISNSALKPLLEFFT